MLTKEEYIDIIEYLDFFYGDNLISTAKLRKEKSKELQKIDLDNFKSKLDKLLELINEHFDNPPLKFEELKEGMWVWDVKNAEWVCIDRPIANVSYCKNLSVLVIFFEENRFYRKQVQEDECY